MTRTLEFDIDELMILRNLVSKAHALKAAQRKRRPEWIDEGYVIQLNDLRKRITAAHDECQRALQADVRAIAKRHGLKTRRVQ